MLTGVGTGNVVYEINPAGDHDLFKIKTMKTGTVDSHFTFTNDSTTPGLDMSVTVLDSNMDVLNVIDAQGQQKPYA